jgi:hypothetical protein
MSKKIIDLSPRWQSTGSLAFDCPLCPKDKTHRVKIDTRWTIRGNFENLRIYPNTIVCKCGAIFGVEKGEIKELERNFKDQQFLAG